MTPEEYRNVLLEAVRRFGELLRRRDEVELEISKTRQFIQATINMLSDEDKKMVGDVMQKGVAEYDRQQRSLADAIRLVLSAAPTRWFTVAEVRDRLRDRGFDFSAYESNPLASVSTTLRRLSPKEATVAQVDGVAAYRHKPTKAARLREARRRSQLYQTLMGVPGQPGNVDTEGAKTMEPFPVPDEKK